MQVASDMKAFLYGLHLIFASQTVPFAPDDPGNDRDAAMRLPIWRKHEKAAVVSEELQSEPRSVPGEIFDL